MIHLSPRWGFGVWRGLALLYTCRPAGAMWVHEFIGWLGDRLRSGSMSDMEKWIALNLPILLSCSVRARRPRPYENMASR